MDTNDTIDDSLHSDNLQLTINAVEHLRSAAKWGKFLAIIGFILVGFIVIFSLFFGTFMGMMGGALNQSALDAAPGFLITIVYLFIAALYFFPAFFLFVFSQKTLRAIGAADSYTLEEALKNLKRLYLFMGIMTVIVLALYAIMFLIAIIGGIAAM